MDMRDRERILANLESLYRDAFKDAEAGEDKNRMRCLDFDFQRDQLQLEVLMDIRDLLGELDGGKGEEGEKKTSLLERAQAIRKLTKLR
jgi:hypothetical protein